MKKTAMLMAALLTVGAATYAQADTLADIKSSGKITVGIDPTFPPYEFTNDKGEITGYSVAIMQSFAKDLGVKLEFQKTAFSGILPGLISGSFNAEGSSLNVTAERAKKCCSPCLTAKRLMVCWYVKVRRRNSAEKH